MMEEPQNDERKSVHDEDNDQVPGGSISPGSYYYDDVTGYEVYQGDEEEVSSVDLDHAIVDEDV